MRDESFLSPGKGGLEDLLGSRDFKGGDGGVSVVGGQRGTIKDQLSTRGIRIILQNLRGEGGRKSGKCHCDK